MEFIRKLLRPVKKHIKNSRTAFYLKKVASRKNDEDKPVRIGFIVFEPETWDKLQPVYEAMIVDHRFIPTLIVLPSFDTNLCLSDEYSYEKEFFEEKYDNVKLAYNNGELLNIKDMGFDYVFYQDPYESHYPNTLKSKDLVKYVKICLIPYGYTLSDNFSNMISNNPFYKNVYINFADGKAYGSLIEKCCSKNIKKGIQSVEYCGYPALAKYMKWECDIEGSITWAPRWSYDSVVGGSHFMEYKDGFVSLRELYPNACILMRPHPMMFSNLISINKMTENEKECFLKELSENNIELNERGAIDDVLKDTKVLIADFSSIIISFFATGRPIIYCDSIFKPTSEFEEILKYVYIAHSWNDVLQYLSEIMNGNDYLKSKRLEFINNGPFEIHKDSTSKILDVLSKRK